MAYVPGIGMADFVIYQGKLKKSMGHSTTHPSICKTKFEIKGSEIDAKEIIL
ncbi:hypothetical protein ACFLUU_00835 [Chloroflexota bacterium]